MNARSRGFKPNTDYRRVPILDVAGRQVNDSAIILKYLLPAIDLEFDEAWEDRIVLELDTSFKLHCTSQDWARLAIATMGAPRFLKWVIGPVVRRVEAKQARNNIANSGLGHKEVDEVAIASDFKSQMQGAYFHGATPGHVDLSLYGFLSGYLHAQCPISTAMVNRSGLASWVDSMNAVVPLEKLFPSR